MCPIMMLFCETFRTLAVTNPVASPPTSRKSVQWQPLVMMHLHGQTKPDMGIR